jgi:hypothetical protein
MPEDLKQKLEAHYLEVIARLRSVAPADTEELLRVIAAKEGLRLLDGAPPAAGASLPYVYNDSAIETIIEWFKSRSNAPADKEDIVRGVLSGGFQLHSPRRELNVTDSIRFHTKKTPHARLKMIGQKIAPK